MSESRPEDFKPVERNEAPASKAEPSNSLTEFLTARPEDVRNNSQDKTGSQPGDLNPSSIYETAKTAVQTFVKDLTGGGGKEDEHQSLEIPEMKLGKSGEHNDKHDSGDSKYGMQWFKEQFKEQLQTLKELMPDFEKTLTGGPLWDDGGIGKPFKPDLSPLFKPLEHKDYGGPLWDDGGIGKGFKPDLEPIFRHINPRDLGGPLSDDGGIGKGFKPDLEPIFRHINPRDIGGPLSDDGGLGKPYQPFKGLPNFKPEWVTGPLKGPFPEIHWPKEKPSFDPKWILMSAKDK